MQNNTITQIEGKTSNGIFYRKTFTSTSQDVFVLVMGYGGSLRAWPTTFVEQLAQKFTVVSYDNRGTGLSIVPDAPEEYTIKAMSDDLREVLTSLGVERHHMLGYSMGSCIALQYAHDYSENVQSLFLMCGTAGGAFYVKPPKEMSTALANPQGKDLWEIYLETWKLMYSPEWHARCMPTFKSIYENSKHCPTRPKALAGHSHAFRGFDGSSYLATLKMPVTILAGAEDRLMPVGNSKNLAQHINQANLVLIDDCEHGPHIQNEDTVVSEIEKLCATSA